MKHETDKVLRYKMNAAHPDELMNSYDEDAIWSNINKENITAAPLKKTYGKDYWRYAAILIVGLLTGFYFNKSKNKEVLTAQKIMIQHARTDTFFVAKTAIKKPAIIAVSTIKKTVQSERKTQTIIAPKEELQHPLPQQSVVEPPSEDVIVFAEKKQISVVYFEDLVSDKEKEIYAVGRKKKRKLIELNKSNEEESSSQELPLRNLFFASNK